MTRKVITELDKCTKQYVTLNRYESPAEDGKMQVVTLPIHDKLFLGRAYEIAGIRLIMEHKSEYVLGYIIQYILNNQTTYRICLVIHATPNFMGFKFILPKTYENLEDTVNALGLI